MSRRERRRLADDKDIASGIQPAPASHRTAGFRFHLLNALLIAGAVLLCTQALAARSVSSTWDFGLLLPLAMGGVLAVLALSRWIAGKPLMQGIRLRRVVQVLLLVSLAVFVLVQGLLIAEPFLHGASRMEKTEETPWLIVLGCGIKPDGTPSWALANRLDAALAWVQAHPGTLLVVSGGQGANEPIPEALSMARYLMARGVSPEDVIVEDRSTSTMENFQYTIPLLREAGWAGESVLFVTNDFHLFRGRLLAARNGLDAYGIGAPTPPVIRPNVYLREFFALFKSLVVDWAPAVPAGGAAAQ